MHLHLSRIQTLVLLISKVKKCSVYNTLINLDKKIYKYRKIKKIVKVTKLIYFIIYII